MSEQGKGMRAQFAKAYAQKGIAKLALVETLGKERAGKMNPHTLRAIASELLNDYLTVVLIEQEKKAARTWATLTEISEKNVWSGLDGRKEPIRANNGGINTKTRAFCKSLHRDRQRIRGLSHSLRC